MFLSLLTEGIRKHFHLEDLGHPWHLWLRFHDVLVEKWVEEHLRKVSIRGLPLLSVFSALHAEVRTVCVQLC